MSNPYVGEIRMFGGNFAPAGWAFCEGQLMPISENDTLFNLIGTTYGGDGQETFAVPDLRGRLPMHAGQGPGLTQNYTLGEQAGVEQVTVSVNQLPGHTHAAMASTGPGNQTSPSGSITANSTSVQIYLEDNVDSNFGAVVAGVGGSQPHDNFQPYLCVNFIISLFGIFPHQ